MFDWKLSSIYDSKNQKYWQTAKVQIFTDFVAPGLYHSAQRQYHGV